MDFHELLVILVADERVDLGYGTDDVCPEGDVGLPELRLVVMWDMKDSKIQL